MVAGLGVMAAQSEPGDRGGDTDGRDTDIGNTDIGDTDNGAGSVPWERAWHEALYGEAGFYRRAEGPSGHFATTATGLGPGVTELLAQALIVLAQRHGLAHVVEIGAAGGELLTALHRQDPHLQLTGVDVGERPVQLPPSVAWCRSPGGAALPPEAALGDLEALVVAHEWLDVVPCPVVQREDAHQPWRLVEVDQQGQERLGGAADPESQRWLARWVPDAAVLRAEVGTTRDQAAAALLSRLRRGVMLIIDYGHTAQDRPEGGSLVGYRHGRLVPPVPDGSTDITAHVAIDSLGADHVGRQGEALSALVAEPPTPSQEWARRDPVGYLRHLQRRADHRTAVAVGGTGDFHWASWLREPPGSSSEATTTGER